MSFESESEDMMAHEIGTSFRLNFKLSMTKSPILEGEKIGIQATGNRAKSILDVHGHNFDIQSLMRDEDE